MRDPIYLDFDRLVNELKHRELTNVSLGPVLHRDLQALLAAVREAHAQYADDLCFMDIDKIFASVNLPVPDRSVGNKAAMKKNCERFTDTMCAEGKWRSYAELEESEEHWKIRALRAEAALEVLRTVSEDVLYRKTPLPRRPSGRRKPDDHKP